MIEVTLVVGHAGYGFAEETTNPQLAITSTTPATQTTTATAPAVSTSAPATATNTTTLFQSASPLTTVQSSTVTRAPEEEAVYQVILQKLGGGGNWPSVYEEPTITKVVNNGETHWTVTVKSKARVDLDGNAANGAETPSYKSIFTVNKNVTDIPNTYWLQGEKNYYENRLMNNRQYAANGYRTRFEERAYRSNGKLLRKSVDLYANDKYASVSHTYYLEDGRTRDNNTTTSFYDDETTPKSKTYISYSGDVRHESTTTYFATNGRVTKKVYALYHLDGVTKAETRTTYYSTEVVHPDGNYQAATTRYVKYYNSRGIMTESATATYESQGYMTRYAGYVYDDSGVVKTGSFTHIHSADGKKKLKLISRQYHPGTVATRILDIQNYETRKRTTKEYDTSGNQVGITKPETIEGPIDVSNLREIIPR